MLFASSTNGDSWGGSEYLWYNTALFLSGDGFDVTVSSARRDSGWRARMDAISGKGGRVLARNRMLSRVRDRLWRILPATVWRNLPRDVVQRNILRRRFDLAVFSDGLNQCYPGWVESCISSATPYVLIAQSVRETEWTKDRLTALLSSYYGRAMRAYFISHANLQTTKLQYCLEGENFEVVRNPFNVPYAADIPWPSSAQGWRMAFVGRLEPGSKGCDLLISVLSSQEWRSRPVTCHFYGSGNNQSFVRRMAEMLGASNCIFHGRVDSVLDVWRANHILVLPSRYEGLPLAIVEAMLCARPVITTDVSGNAELLEDNVTGFVAPAPSHKSLGEAMKRAWARRENWEQMGIVAAESVRRHVPKDPASVFAEKLCGLACERIRLDRTGRHSMR